jgi:type II secretory pathway component PulF
MLAIGLPISAAMNAQYDTTTNIVYKSILKDIAAGLEKGATIASTLKKKHSQFVPLVAIKMIGVGEKTGKLDEIFIYLGEYYEEEVEDISKTLSTVLEPIILIAVGLIVAFIAIAIIGPIYQFTGSISRQ